MTTLVPYARSVRALLRSSVLETVDELIRSEGWTATSISAIAARAGVSRQTIYNAFGSRQSIAHAYVVDRLDRVLHTAREAISDETQDRDQAIRSVLNLVFDAFDEPLIHTALSGGGIGSDDLVDLMRVCNVQSIDAVSEFARQLQPNLTTADSQFIADMIVRLALSHIVVPAVPREIAVEQMARVVDRLLS